MGAQTSPFEQCKGKWSEINGYFIDANPDLIPIKNPALFPERGF